MKPDRAATKTRIVFKAPARYQGLYLDDVIGQGPKLHPELFHALFILVSLQPRKEESRRLAL